MPEPMNCGLIIKITASLKDTASSNWNVVKFSNQHFEVNEEVDIEKIKEFIKSAITHAKGS